jgi:uncharacterized protein (TIGR03067 family)
MQGRWKVLVISEDGNPFAGDPKEIFTFDKNKVILANAGTSYTFQLNASTRPKALDLFLGGKESQPRRAIYDFEMAGKRLKICFAIDPKKGRPAEFTSRDGSGLRLMILEPATDDDGDARAVSAIKKLGGVITRDDEAPGRPVVKVVFFRIPVTNADLKTLTQLTELQTLGLMFSHVSDVGLKELARLKKLQWLDLTSSPISDAGLKDLAPLKGLQKLILRGCKRVTDAATKDLAVFEHLESLDLTGTQVSAAAVAELQKALPRCRIFVK